MAKDDEKKGDDKKTLDQPPRQATTNADPVPGQPRPGVNAPAFDPNTMDPVRRFGGEQATQQQPQVIMVQQQAPRPPDPIPGFSDRAEGGHYVTARGQRVDAHGKAIPEGKKQQRRDVFEGQRAAADDISLTPPPDPADERTRAE